MQLCVCSARSLAGSRTMASGLRPSPPAPDAAAAASCCADETRVASGAWLSPTNPEGGPCRNGRSPKLNPISAFLRQTAG